MARPARMTTATLPILLLTLLLCALPSRAVVPCNGTDADVCERRLWPGSACRDGFCTNPFRSGCLRALFASDRYDNGGASAALRRRLLAVPRTCNAEDVGGEDAGVCARHANDYPEVRVWAQNWESAVILAWIMQILYSELLNVPSTIETGVKGKNINFYDAENRMGWGKANEYEMFQNAHNAKGGDCSVYMEGNAGAAEDDYKPCAHLVMDVWASNEKLEAAQDEGAAETMEFTGMLAFSGWHITRFSIKRDPSLANHFGLAGEENREKLAERFKRPTTWRTYCNEVSATNCTTADGVAVRPPSEEEASKYFVAGEYTGFFRKTEKNDCGRADLNCTGHFMDYPCGWTSYVKQQTHHLGIALESNGNDDSGGYSYGEMVEIWKAANATKSDVIGMWWIPDATAKLLTGSGSDLIPVMLPPTTTVCNKNRVDGLKRCEPSATEFDIYGDEKGACGQGNEFTKKGAVGSMQKNIEENPKPKGRMSPAYDVYKAFTITDLEVDEILSEWVDRGLDRDNFDLRFATCQWVADNLDDIVEKFVPQSHPRSFVDTSKQFYRSPLTIVALVLSIIAVLSTMGTTGFVLYKRKHGGLGRGAQIDFMLLILAGMFLVSVGSLLRALDPTNGVCVGAMWMTNVGYTAQLVPILVCVSTIIKVVRASTKMQKINVNRKHLVTRSIAFIGIAVVFSTLWTLLDPPECKYIYHVSDETNDLGETIVSESHYCLSNSEVLSMLSYVFQGLLLACATALAFQMRSVPASINNSRELATMIYSSVIFLVLRVLCFSLSMVLSDGSLGKDFLHQVRSLLLSIDTMANIVIYFTRYFKLKKTDISTDVNRWASTNYPSSVPSDLKSGEMCPPHQVEAQEVPKKSMDAINESHCFSSEDKLNQLGGPDTSEISTEEEKEEEASPTVRFRMKDKSVTLPKWVVVKYGETEVHREQEQTIVLLGLSEKACSEKDQTED